MDFRHHRHLFPPEIRDQLDDLYRAFQARGDGDTYAFVASLLKEGRISAQQLVEVLASEELQLGELHRRPPHVRRHRLLGLLGRGAMGEVFFARDDDLRRIVAVKRLNPAHALSHQARRFQNEALITAQLDHPGIVAVHAMEALEDELPTYAMKLVRGQTLEELIAEARTRVDRDEQLDGPLSLDRRLSWFLDVCDTIAYAHNREVLHRDLKPENIMVGAYNQVLVMDWGIAKLVRRSEDPAGNVPSTGEGTQVGTALGTAPYMSPEQAEGRNDDLDARSDQYALGLILHELLALQRAVTAPNQIAAWSRATQGSRDPLLPRGSGAPVPPELVAVVDKACAFDPKDRYQDVSALAEDVRRFLRDEPVTARPDPPLRRLQRWVRRHSRLTVAAVFVLVLAVVGLGVVGFAVSVAAREAQQRQAALREEQLGMLLSDVTRTGHDVDTRLQAYEALVEGIATATERALREPVRPRRFYLAHEFRDPATAPPDARNSAVYGDGVSLAEPDLVLAPGVDVDSVREQLYALASLQPELLGAQLQSADPAAVQRPFVEKSAMLLDQGVPLVWVYVATEQGVLVGYPGLGEYPVDYDPRTRPWYGVAKQARGDQVWTALDADESGLGLLVTCSVGVYDPNGELLGVAAADLTFHWLIDNLLRAEDLPAGAESFLVDDRGNVVTRSSLQKVAATVNIWEPLPFPEPALLARIEAGPHTGHLEIDDADGLRLVAWTQLAAVPWRYIVLGPSVALLGGSVPG